jgi:hypothetical protein
LVVNGARAQAFGVEAELVALQVGERGEGKEGVFVGGEGVAWVPHGF